MPTDFESQMKFIIEQRSKFSAGIQLLKERHEEIARMTAANAEAIQANTGMIRQLIDVNMSLTHHLEQTDAQLRQFMAATEKRSAEADERFADTDERLNALIKIMDKMIRRNGGAATH